MVEEELVTAWSTQLSITEKNPDLGSRSVGIVGVDLDDHGNLVWGISLEGDMIDNDLVLTDTGSLVDSPVNDILGDALGTGFFERGKESGVRCGIRTTLLRSDGDFSDELPCRLRLLEGCDLAFREEPLATHRRRKVKVLAV